MGVRGLATLPLVLAMACGTPSGPEGPSLDGRKIGEAGSGVVITLPKSSYKRGSGPEGAITNNTGATIYVLAGDRWASETQQQVYLAGGSDVRVERQTSNGWESVDVDVLMVEGVGLVRIPDGATYPIRGGFGSKVANGTYRLRVEYYGDRDRSAGTRNVTVSKSFKVD